MPIPLFSLEKKLRVPQLLSQHYRQLRGNRYGIIVKDRIIPLQPLDEPENLDAADKAFAHAATMGENSFWNNADNTTACGPTPDSVDHRPHMTPVRNQEDRGTCVCFASLAAVEAFLKADGDAIQDLSEQYANWVYMGFEQKDWCSDGLITTNSAKYLSQRGVCAENLCPYERLATVQTHCGTGPNQSARNNAKFGIGTYTLIDRLGLNGPSIANTDYLECILHQGFNVVFGTHVAWGNPDPVTGVYDLVLDPYGNPAAPAGGHAMLLVGYKRNAPEPYFIFKNSWSDDAGVGGYYYLSYDYVRQYAKYGYIVNDIRRDMQ